MGGGWQGECFSWAKRRAQDVWKGLESLCCHFNPNQERKVTVVISSLGSWPKWRLWAGSLLSALGSHAYGWLKGVGMAEGWTELRCRCNKGFRSTLWDGSSELAHLEAKGPGLHTSSSASHWIQAMLLGEIWSWVTCELSAIPTVEGMSDSVLKEVCVGTPQHPLWN